jgi:hypothetical protein
MSNLRLKEVANEATNKDFYNSFFTASRVTTLIGYFGQFISALTEFHFIFTATGGAYQPWFIHFSNILPCLSGLIAIYIFEVVGVRVFLVRIIRQIVNLDFQGNERKMLFGFNLIFVLVLCGSNLLLSVLGQKYSFEQKTNVTTTDKTHQLSNEKAAKVGSINSHFDGLQATLINNYDNDKTSIQTIFDADIKQLKNSQKKFEDLEWKYNEYTLKIDSKGEAKTTDLNALLSQLNIDKELIRSDRTTQINTIRGTYDNRINDVSNVATSNVDLWIMVQKYTMPILVIFILLSWVAIIYNEIFLKGAGQTIEIKEVAKKPLLIVIFISGIYEKIYQLFYWIVAKVIGNKKYRFGEIQQDIVKYQIKQKQTGASPIILANNLRPIGFNRNKQQPNNNQINNQTSGNESEDLSENKSMNLDVDGDRITVTVPTEKNNKKRCVNCGKVYTYKHWNSKYCTDKCRIENWENRTGKTMNKKSKKS